MAKARPSPDKNLRISLIGWAFILGWFFLPSYGTDIFYGKYGALLFGTLAAGIAYIKNRNVVAWFAVGQWTVLAGVTVALIVPRLADALCPFCREAIDPEASVCPHCQREVPRKQESKAKKAASGL